MLSAGGDTDEVRVGGNVRSRSRGCSTDGPPLNSNFVRGAQVHGQILTAYTSGAFSFWSMLMDLSDKVANRAPDSLRSTSSFYFDLSVCMFDYW